MGDYDDALMRGNNAAVQARAKQQNRANVLQLKLIGQGHPTGLTSNLLRLFEPRPPLEYKPAPEKRKCPPYAGIAEFVSKFAEPDDPEYAPPVQKGEIRAQKRARIQRLRLEKGAIKVAEELQKYDPQQDPNISGDPYKTLFVARLSYETTEHRIKRDFETYGPIKRKVRLITDKESNKPRGYAFIEYIHTRDMKSAYKQADGRKLDDRRVLVDVERGRTVPNWRPRRLGGGLGSTRVGAEDDNQKHSGREPQQITSRHSRSVEPKDRHVDRDREKSRDRRDRDGDRDREKSREQSNDRIREWDPREERHHHRDRDRSKDMERDRQRDRGRDRDQGRDRERDRGYGRNYDHGRDRDRDHDRGRDRERDRGYAQERGDHRERPSGRARDYGYGEPDHGQAWYDGAYKHGREEDYDEYDHHRGAHREQQKQHGLEQYDQEPYNKVEDADYRRNADELPEEGEAC